MVGTVIDPELRDEVRVTVIVTGLGRKQTVAGLKIPVIDTVKPDTLHSVDYDQLERPTIIRRQTVTPLPSSQQATPAAAQGAAPRQAAATETVTHDIDYLDIPAFLRRKEEEEA